MYKFRPVCLLFLSSIIMSQFTLGLAADADALFGRFISLYSVESFQNYRAVFSRITPCPNDLTENTEELYSIRVNGGCYVGECHTKLKNPDGNWEEWDDLFSWNGKLAVAGNKTDDIKGNYVLDSIPKKIHPDAKVTCLLDCLGISVRDQTVRMRKEDGSVSCILKPLKLEGKTLVLGLRSDTTGKELVLEKVIFEDTDSLVFSKIEFYSPVGPDGVGVYESWRDFSGRKLPTRMSRYSEKKKEHPYVVLTLKEFQACPDDKEDYVLSIPYADGIMIQDNSFSPPFNTAAMNLNETLLREKNYRQATAQRFVDRDLDIDKLKKSIVDNVATTQAPVKSTPSAVSSPPPASKPIEKPAPKPSGMPSWLIALVCLGVASIAGFSVFFRRNRKP